MTNGTLAPGAAGTAPPLTSVAGSGTASLTLVGTVAAVNAALDGLTFTPANGFAGAVTLTVTTTDLGNSGSGGPLSDVDTVTITVGALPTVSIDDPAVPEGDAGSASTLTFTVALSGPSALPVTVPYSVGAGTTATGGTACASGIDVVTPTSSPLVIPAGATQGTIVMPVCGDTLAEGDETVRIDLGAPTNATVADGQGVGTIQDDDGAPRLTIADATVAEGDAGTATLTFSVTLSPPSATPVTVPYATANGTTAPATGGAACGPNVDYLTTNGTLTFQPGATSETITVTVCADSLVEGDETVLVSLGTPTGGATVADGQAVGTIQDDDVAGTLSFTQAAVSASEHAGSATLTVTRSGGGTASGASARGASPAAAGEVTVAYATANGTATAGQDYVATSGTLTFGVGETTQTIVVPILTDEHDELPETFTVTLSAPTGGATPGAVSTATVTITDTDTTPCQTTLAADVPAGSSVLPVISQAGCAVGDTIAIDAGQPNEELATIVGFGSLVIQQPTTQAHRAGAVVARVTGDLPQTAPYSPGDDDTDKPRKETEEQRRQRERTNRGSRDDDAVEGDVVETRCDDPWPTVAIANRDGLVEVRLLAEAQAACHSIAVGDYLEADGEKQHEHLFDADGVEVKRRR